MAYHGIGSRFVSNTEDNFRASRIRRIGIQILSKLIRAKTDMEIFDTTSGFRAVLIIIGIVIMGFGAR